MRDAEINLRNILGLEYGEYVKQLSKSLKNEKFFKLINMGLEDGFVDDEKVKVDSGAKFICRELIPTQSQISLSDSLGWLSRNKPDEILNLLQNKTEHYEKNRILVANGKYILDGHHRWAVLTMINPDAEMPSVNLDFGEEMDVLEILKYIQLGISATYGKISGTRADEKTDILHGSMWGNKLRKELGETMGTNVINTLKAHLGMTENWEVIEYVYDNVMLIKELKMDFGPARKDMPQPSKTAKSVGRSKEQTKDYLGLSAEFINKMASGELNYKDPFLKENRTYKLRRFTDF